MKSFSTENYVSTQELESIVGTAGICRWQDTEPCWQERVEKAVAPDTEIHCTVYPNTQEELAAVIAWAQQNRCAVLPCGSGSKLDWGGLVKFDSDPPQPPLTRGEQDVVKVGLFKGDLGGSRLDEKRHLLSVPLLNSHQSDEVNPTVQDLPASDEIAASPEVRAAQLSPRESPSYPLRLHPNNKIESTVNTQPFSFSTRPSTVNSQQSTVNNSEGVQPELILTSLLLRSEYAFHTHSSHAQRHHSHAENCHRLQLLIDN
ncbi:hypothetical protein ON021_01265 [Microcoleus sp. HI-ES]|nr:hypothetical protein [Microcoleus sp. HI-ES]